MIPPSKEKILHRFQNLILPDIEKSLFRFWRPPAEISDIIRERLCADTAFSEYKSVIFTGETNNTTIYICGNKSMIIYTPFQNIEENKILESSVMLGKRGDHVCLVAITDEIMDNLSLPRVLLVNPSVNDVFPVPRLALCVASLASYLRKKQKALVSIIDMQIGATFKTIMDTIRTLEPDIIGISISFGQTALAVSILRSIFSKVKMMSKKPVVVAGNVVAAFMADKLIRIFPDLVVCRAEGELSITGLVDYVRGRKLIGMVPGIVYLEQGRIRRTPIEEVEMDDIPLPAMDTVEGIVKNNGALTIEISRGCSHSACSFCPRTHKPKKWKGMSAENVLSQLQFYRQVFDDFGIMRRVFMADEEFIGWMETGGEVDRVNDIAQGMIDKDMRIHFETSTRIDQIYDHNKDKAWHIDRMRMLDLCKTAGLDRLLVGIESGSDSVLRRFNKGIVAQDSVMAIRILSALGIGFRATFITFDPLMTFTELKENIAFLGRKDICLKPLTTYGISYSDLFDGIHEANFVQSNSTNTPLYQNISYMLVLLEILMDCDYIQLLHRSEKKYSKNLFLEHGTPDINMARYKVSYLDKRIGDIAAACQRWIDRHFALDYYLKGIFKTANENERETIFKYRLEYRRLSYNLLESLTWIFDDDGAAEVTSNIVDKKDIVALRERAKTQDRSRIIMETLDLFNDKMDLLVGKIESSPYSEKRSGNNANLKKVIERWRRKKSWDLINP